MRRSCPADVLRRQAGDSDANYDEAIAAVLADNEYSVEAQTKVRQETGKAEGEECGEGDEQKEAKGRT